MLNANLTKYTHGELEDYTHLQLKLMGIGDLVTDRTHPDVERWRELRDKGWSGMTEYERLEWLGEITTTPAATKGMYTHNDLNRVENYVELLSAELKRLGYIRDDLSTRTDWTYESNIWREDAERYLSNIEKLRNCIGLKPNTPVTPDVSDTFDYESANNIEKILEDIGEVTTKLTQSWQFAGEIIAGEV